MKYGMYMNRLTAISALVAMGCATEPAFPDAGDAGTDRNEQAVSELLDALDVQRTLSLALDPVATLQLDPGCQVDVDTATGLSPHVEQVTRWQGPCQLGDGALLEGSLTLAHTADGQFLSADGFSITENGSVSVMLSGAMALARIDNLVELNVAMHACGALGSTCSDADSTTRIDLEYSIYPMDTYPHAFTVGVGGAVDGEEMIVSVEGAWKTDHAVCDAEPIEGSVVLDTFPRQTLTLEGTGQCDGCMGWQIEGIDVAPLCLDTIW